MKIGIFIHSQTGNTLAVAKLLQNRLEQEGHSVVMEQLQVEGKIHPKMKLVVFAAIPSPDPYDAIILGSPVEAFSLSPVMVQFMKQMARLNGKPVALMLTHFFPFHKLGGTQALKVMTELAATKGAHVIGSEIIDWSHRGREKMISESIGRLSALFKTT